MSDDVPAARGEHIKDSETLVDGLRAGKVGIWRWTIDTDVLDWSPDLHAVHALEKERYDGTLSSFQNDVHPEDAGALWATIRRSVETGEPYRATYRTRSRIPGGEVWIEAAGEVVNAPDGKRYLTGACYDVSSRVRTEQELEKRLRQQKAVEEFGLFAFTETNLDAVMDRAVQIAADVLDCPLTKILCFAGSADHLVLRAGVGWAEGLIGNGTVGTDRLSQAGYTLQSSEPVIVYDLRAESRFDGPQLLHDHGVRSGISVVIPGPSSRPFGVFGVHSRDVRSFGAADAEFLRSIAMFVANAVRNCEASEHRHLLLREMAHRAGNMLQIVSTIANQTFSETANFDTARRAFSERLGSLARANYLVAQGGWTSTRVSLLLQETLQPFADRMALTGRDVLLPPEMCFDLALVVHELAMNAAKYGSLGRRDSKAELSWDIERGTDAAGILVLRWADPINNEADHAKPHKGFGTRLLERLIVQKWGGDIAFDRTNGFLMTAHLPFDPV